jgi:hypothetical protein
MIDTPTPYRSSIQAGHDGFPQLLRAEWTKFRTVRGWVLGMVAAALVTILVSVLAALAGHNHAGTPSATVLSLIGPAGASDLSSGIATGPGGEAVTDNFYFVHRSLDGNGSITIRVTSLRSSGKGPAGAPGQADPIQPWAKAGVIIKESTRAGSPYAAIMVTPGHGVRMQYNFTNDTAGIPGAVSAASPRWLRLTRSGDTITGYESTDGKHWSVVGTADLTGLPPTVQAGLFVASPTAGQPTQTFSRVINGGTYPTQATATFDDVSMHGDWPGHAWRGTEIGLFGKPGAQLTVPPGLAKELGFSESGGKFTVAGSGDIAPYTPGIDPMEVALKSVLFGLIAVIAVGALFITAEYRRGLIRTTLTMSPRRGRVLVAKVLVIGSVTFVFGLIAAAIAIPISAHILRSHGWLPPEYQLLSLLHGPGPRLVIGTAGILAAAAILALALGTLLRRSAGAVATVIVLLLLPEILAIVLPMTAAQWLLRVTPAAAFAVQQSVPTYPQTNHVCLPTDGCYPLAPWTGFAVLCAYALVALAVAVFMLRRRDA